VVVGDVYIDVGMGIDPLESSDRSLDGYDVSRVEEGQWCAQRDGVAARNTAAISEIALRRIQSSVFSTSIP
jgi:hypothetical protein